MSQYELQMQPQPFSQENADTVPKKPGATDTLSRPPLQDRAVNPASSKGAPNHLKKPALSPARLLSPIRQNFDDDDLFMYDSYSDKDFNGNDLDFKFLTPRDTFNILRAYCNYNGFKTPVPELPLDFTLAEITGSHFSFGVKDAQNPPEESIDDVCLPDLDF